MIVANTSTWSGSRGPRRIRHRRRGARGLGQTRAAKLCYTLPALADLAAILDYIDAHSAQGARQVQARVQSLAELLLQHPKTAAAPAIRAFAE
jgi:hypothetical protein